MPETQVEPLNIRDRLKTHELFADAVRGSSLRPWQKFRLLMLYRIPGIRNDVDEYIEQTVKERGNVNAMANGDIIKIIIDKLPEIIAFIELLLRLFGST